MSPDMASLEPPGVNMGPPRKRQRILSPSLTNSTTSTQMSLEGTAAKSCGHNRTVMSDTGFQPDREAQVGIIHFVNSANVGFTGTLKQRYVKLLLYRASILVHWLSFDLYLFVVLCNLRYFCVQQGSP